MFTWILIILAIAFIFGVIKVDQIKDLIKKHEPKVREIADKTTTFIKQKYAEINKQRAINSTKNTSTESSSENKKDSTEVSDEK